MEKLSKKLMQMKRENWTDAARSAMGSDVWHKAATRAIAFGVAAQLAEAYEAEVGKRIAELEAMKEMPGRELWSAAEEHHAARLELEKRVSELERWNGIWQLAVEFAESNMKHLQSQLAWTPVSDGLPTEPGWYEVASESRKAVDVFQVRGGGDVGLWWWLRDVQYESPLERYPSATHFRRIALQEQTP
jgi:hypothetical protein